MIPDLKKASETFLKTPGIIRGTRAIAQFMGVSPSTISRWRRRFKGRTEVALCFPAMEFPTGHGWSVAVWTNTALINEWMRRWAMIDGEALRERAPRKRHGKGAQKGETGKNAKAGSAPEKPLTLHEELALLSEPERQWVIANELTTAELAELGLPPRPVQVTVPKVQVCTCGTSRPCTAH